ncbi:MAG: RND transporter [Gammaproteobacteria bacterium]
MFTWLERIPLNLLIIVCLTLGLAPFLPEPHVWEKLKMLASGDLHKAIDIFDLLLHGTPWMLLMARVIYSTTKKSRSG